MGDGPYDEAHTASGAPRPHYGAIVEALGRHDLGELRRRVAEAVAARGILFGGAEPVRTDPVPRALDAAEWRELEAGIRQRALALNAFLLDAYGEQLIFEQGAVPRRLLDTSAGYEPLMRGLLDPGAPPATVTGLDLVREPGGEMVVLEDNARMPSGAAYALALREIVEEELGAGAQPLPPDAYVAALGAALRGGAPDGAGEPSMALLSSGEGSSAWFEHRALAAALDVPLATPDRLSGGRGSPTELGELLLPALRSGRLRCLNAFGAGIADDKLTHAYVERMVRFYLGEEPLLRSLPSFDLGDEAAGAAERRRTAEAVRERPGTSSPRRPSRSPFTRRSATAASSRAAWTCDPSRSAAPAAQRRCAAASRAMREAPMG
jgi:uncharacterized circularly permuted ATP-grasp superfamily protein